MTDFFAARRTRTGEGPKSNEDIEFFYTYAIINSKRTINKDVSKLRFPPINVLFLLCFFRGKIRTECGKISI